MTLILIVDDEPHSLSGLEALVRAEGFGTATAADLEGARRELDCTSPDAVLVDYYLPDGKGIELAAAAVERGIDFILVTGEATVDTAVEALRAGALDFLTKPVDAARLKTLLEQVARSTTFRREIAGLRVQLRELGRFGSMVGSSQAMQAVYDRVLRVAPTDASVLVTGESGTGKELVAEALHRISRRAHRPFVATNCGAIAANLIESELFGHERGAFTGADRQRKGVFERAHQGTLFLDEISEMQPDLQVKLLRVLESGTFTRVGGEKSLNADVRVVAASNRDLDASVAEGRFRADLLYRLRVVPITLPPVRERAGDVRELSLHFLAGHCESERVRKTFAPAALRALEEYSFPGNVRELRNAVHHAFILAEDEILPQHLPVEIAEPRGSASATGASGDSRASGAAGAATADSVTVRLPASLSDVERQVILATVEQAGGDKARAAEVLGISLKTLYSRLREYSGRTAS